MLPYFNLGVAFSRLGRLEEAQAAVETGLALNPAYSASGSRARASYLSTSDDPIYQAGIKRFAEGLRMAGVPE